MEVGRKVLLQLAKSAPCRLRDARELRPLNGRGGQRSRGKRLFQSVPAKDAQCPQPPVKGLSQLRKRAGQSGGRRKRRARAVYRWRCKPGRSLSEGEAEVS